MNAIDTAKRYFELSNESNFEAIAELFSDQASYNSQNTGEYRGKDDIIAMQKAFHSQFKTKAWTTPNGYKEIKPGLVLVDYEFNGTTMGEQTKQSSGLEYITVKNGLITRVEIKNM